LYIKYYGEKIRNKNIGGACLHGLQEQKLCDDKKQAQYSGKAQTKKILQKMPRSPGTQRSRKAQVVF